MEKIAETYGEYTLIHVTYQRDNGTDFVCQVKKYGAEICHCTWHPDGAVHCKDRRNDDYSFERCPCYGVSFCERTAK